MGVAPELDAGRTPNGWVTRPVRLSGHAQVLVVEPSPAAGEPPHLLATPLYVQYAQRG